MINRKLKYILIAIVLISLGVGARLFLSPAEEQTTYVSVKVERGQISSSVLSTGVVKPENRVEIKPSIAGRAERILVSEGDEVKKGQTLLWMSSTERAALLDAARAQGEAELKRWENLYKATPILAPVSGTVIQRQIEEGQTFATTDPILVMSDRLIVEAQVDETDLARVFVGQKAQVTLDAYSDQKISSAVGNIAYEATTVNNVTTYVVKVVPDRVPDFMRSGMTANVRFEISAKAESLVIPSEALRVVQGKYFVLKAAEAPGAQPLEVPVGVGLSDGQQTEVRSGLNEGDTVLIQQKAEQVQKSDGGTNPFMPSRPRGNRSPRG